MSLLCIMHVNQEAYNVFITCTVPKLLEALVLWRVWSILIKYLKTLFLLILFKCHSKQWLKQFLYWLKWIKFGIFKFWKRFINYVVKYCYWISWNYSENIQNIIHWDFIKFCKINRRNAIMYKKTTCLYILLLKTKSIQWPVVKNQIQWKKSSIHKLFFNFRF